MNLLGIEFDLKELLPLQAQPSIPLFFFCVFTSFALLFSLATLLDKYCRLRKA